MFCVIGSPITLLCGNTRTSNTFGISPRNSQTHLYFSSAAGIKITYLRYFLNASFCFLVYFLLLSLQHHLFEMGRGRSHVFHACTFLSVQRMNKTRQSLHQFHPGTPACSRATACRMLGGGKGGSHPPQSVFKSAPISCYDLGGGTPKPARHFLQQLLGKRGRGERPKGKTLTEHSKTIPDCQNQRHSGHEADNVRLL